MGAVDVEGAGFVADFFAAFLDFVDEGGADDADGEGKDADAEVGDDAAGGFAEGDGEGVTVADGGGGDDGPPEGFLRGCC